MQKIDCQILLEKLPLWFAGSLSEQEIKEMSGHLKDCPDCLERYRQEYPLFALAGSKAGSAILEDHTDSKIIDQYVFERTALTADQLREIESHLSSCSLCRETVEHLEMLPQSAEDFVPADQAPRIFEINNIVSRVFGETKTKTPASIIRWKPLFIFASAALLVMIAISQIDLGRSRNVTRLSVTFPAALRGQDKELIFESPTQRTMFDARLYIDPEEDHRYEVQIIDSFDSPVFDNPNLAEFDNLGYALIEFELVPGRYKLIVKDIIDDDTVTTERLFSVRKNVGSE